MTEEVTTTNIGLLLEDDPGVSGTEAHFCHAINITCYLRVVLYKEATNGQSNENWDIFSSPGSSEVLVWQ